MLVNFNANNRQTAPQFQARFSQKDIKKLMASAKEQSLLMQDIVAHTAEKMTSIVPEKAVLDANTMYGRLNVILEHVDKLIKGKLVSLVEEKLPTGEKTFKIINENNKVLGSGREPILALNDAFVMRGKYELAPQYWGNKLPDRVFTENQQKLGTITENDILAKSLN